jgi:beta-lactamase superfamily II metal-dependent hydrolase
MRSRSTEKLFSTIFYVAIIFAFFIWFIVYQNANASVKDGQAKLSFLDVGQADCAILNLPNSVQVVIDTGRDATVVSSIASRMPTFDKKIEYIMLSHPDSDHVGGFDAISQSYEIGEVIRSDAQSESKTWQKIVEDIKAKNIREEIVGANDDIYIESTAKFHILWPNDQASLSSNNKSIIANLSVGKAKAIFMGDAEIEAQSSVMAYAEPEDLMAQIIKVSHHGSTNGLNLDFLNIVKPQFSVVSVGKNSYGHPAESVLSAYVNLGIQYFRTDQVGTVDFVTNGDGWTKK